jgi:hypothetical protein
MPWIRAEPDGVVLTVHAAPRARRSEVAGLHGDALKIRLAAPPVDGKANRELVRFLAERLGRPAVALRVLAGETGRHKRVAVAGVTPDQARNALLSGPAGAEAASVRDKRVQV